MKIFLNHINSYHGNAIIKILKENIDEHDFEIIATIDENIVFNENILQLSFVKKLINQKLDETFINDIISCDIIVYDIGKNFKQINEAKRILQSLEQQIENNKNNLKKNTKHYFLLISTLMTWSKTESTTMLNDNEDDDEDDDDNGGGGDDDRRLKNETITIFTDKDYRNRRSHPCYTTAKELERQVIFAQQRHQNYLKTLVICPGVTYGNEEDIFEYLFKRIYLNEKTLQIFKPGHQFIPIVNILDFSKNIYNILSNWPNYTTRYCLMVEPNFINMYEITEIIIQNDDANDRDDDDDDDDDNTNEYNNKIKIELCDKEDILLMDKNVVTELVYNYCTLNLQMRSSKYFQYKCDIRVDMNLFKEFYNAKNLYPIKIIIDGPPASGKTTIARKLANLYHLHYLCTTDDEFLLKNVDTITIGSQSNNEQIKNASMESDMDNSTDNSVLLDNLRKRLNSKACSKRQGYILDGFPFTLTEAEHLLYNDDKEQLNAKIEPNLFILLEVEDNSILCNRAMHNNNIKFTEEQFLNRLTNYNRNLSEEDNHYLSFLYDNNCIPLHLTITECISNDIILNEIIDKLGKLPSPTGYPMIKSEIDVELQLRKELDERVKQQKRKEFDVMAQQENELREKKLQNWTDEYLNVKCDEQKLLEIRSLPLRNYLQNFVLPYLTEGLLEVVTIKPIDPIDYLAEYLFKIKPNDVHVADDDDDNLNINK